jgi:hypothetical protein
MNIHDVIKLLEDNGFHLCSRKLKGNRLFGAFLVQTAYDLYARVYASDQYAATQVTFSGPGLLKYEPDRSIFSYTEELQERITRHIQYAEEQMEILLQKYDKFDAALDVMVAEQVAELKQETGRGFEFVWYGEGDYLKGLYRGAVLEINNHLRVIWCDGHEVLRDDLDDDYPESDEDAGISLEDAFDQIDDTGRLEKQQIEEELKA